LAVLETSRADWQRLLVSPRSTLCMLSPPSGSFPLFGLRNNEMHASERTDPHPCGRGKGEQWSPCTVCWVPCAAIWSWPLVRVSPTHPKRRLGMCVHVGGRRHQLSQLVCTCMVDVCVCVCMSQTAGSRHGPIASTRGRGPCAGRGVLPSFTKRRGKEARHGRAHPASHSRPVHLDRHHHPTQCQRVGAVSHVLRPYDQQAGGCRCGSGSSSFPKYCESPHAPPPT
jgi:hypothetical protein